MYGFILWRHHTIYNFISHIYYHGGTFYISNCLFIYLFISIYLYISHVITRYFVIKVIQKLFLPHARVKLSIVGSLRDREIACSASDRQGSNFESCVWRTVSSHSSHHLQEILLAQFSLYVHKGGLKPDSFHFIQLKIGSIFSN